MVGRAAVLAVVVLVSNASAPPDGNQTSTEDSDSSRWDSGVPMEEEDTQIVLKIIIAVSVITTLFICALLYCCWRYFQFRSIDDQSMARFQSSYSIEELGEADLVEYASLSGSRSGTPTQKKTSGQSSHTQATEETLHPPKMRDSSGSSMGGTLETSLLRSSFRSPPNSGSTGGGGTGGGARAGGSGSSVLSGDKLPPRSRNVTFVNQNTTSASNPDPPPTPLTLAGKSLSSSLTRYTLHTPLKPPTSPAHDNTIKSSIANTNSNRPLTTLVSQNSFGSFGSLPGRSPSLDTRDALL